MPSYKNKKLRQHQKLRLFFWIFWQLILQFYQNLLFTPLLFKLFFRILFFSKVIKMRQILRENALDQYKKIHMIKVVNSYKNNPIHINKTFQQTSRKYLKIQLFQDPSQNPIQSLYQFTIIDRQTVTCINMFNQKFQANSLLKIINQHIKQLQKFKGSMSTQTKQSVRIQYILTKLSEYQRGEQITLKEIALLITKYMKLQDNLNIALAQKYHVLCKFDRERMENSMCECIKRYEKTIQNTLDSLQTLVSCHLPNNTSNNSLYKQMKTIQEQTNKIKQELLFNNGHRQPREELKGIQNGINCIWGNTSSIKKLLQDIQHRLTFIKMEISSLVDKFMLFQSGIKYMKVYRLKEFQKQISRVLKELGQDC